MSNTMSKWHVSYYHLVKLPLSQIGMSMTQLCLPVCWKMVKWNQELHVVFFFSPKKSELEHLP